MRIRVVISQCSLAARIRLRPLASAGVRSAWASQLAAVDWGPRGESPSKTTTARARQTVPMMSAHIQRNQPSLSRPSNTRIVLLVVACRVRRSSTCSPGSAASRWCRSCRRCRPGSHPGACMPGAAGRRQSVRCIVNYKLVCSRRSNMHRRRHCYGACFRMFRSMTSQAATLFREQARLKRRTKNEIQDFAVLSAVAGKILANKSN